MKVLEFFDHAISFRVDLVTQVNVLCLYFVPNIYNDYNLFSKLKSDWSSLVGEDEIV